MGELPLIAVFQNPVDQACRLTQIGARQICYPWLEFFSPDIERIFIWFGSFGNIQSDLSPCHLTITLKNTAKLNKNYPKLLNYDLFT